MFGKAYSPPHMEIGNKNIYPNKGESKSPVNIYIGTIGGSIACPDKAYSFRSCHAAHTYQCPYIIHYVKAFVNLEFDLQKKARKDSKTKHNVFFPYRHVDPYQHKHSHEQTKIAMSHIPKPINIATGITTNTP